MIQIVMVGNPFDGMKAYGPFFSPEDAAEFGDTCEAHDWRVVDLEAPYSEEYDALPGAFRNLPVGLFSGQMPDFGEALVTLWPDGDVEMATRLTGEAWGPPIVLEQKETR